MSISFEDVSKKKLKAWQKALLAVSGAAALLGVALFMFSAQFGTKGAEYAKKADGAAYSAKRGVLRKDGQILYRTPFWDWLRGDPMIGWKIGFIGALVTFVQSILYRKKRRKTGKK